MEDKTIFCMTV